MRLIDADLFDKELEEYFDRHWEGEFYACEDIRSMLEDAPTVNPYEWISVEDELPELFVDVLVFRNGKIEIDYNEDDGWFAYDFEKKRATHWMPLPQPPAEKEN